MENKFAGSAERGKEKFELIKRRLEISQRETNRQRELEYLNRGDEMETDEFDSNLYHQNRNDNNRRGGGGGFGGTAT